MHRLSGKFHLIPTSRHLRLCEYNPRNQKGRQAALPGLRTAKMQTGGGAEGRFGSFSEVSDRVEKVCVALINGHPTSDVRKAVGGSKAEAWVGISRLRRENPRRNPWSIGVLHLFALR